MKKPPIPKQRKPRRPAKQDPGSADLLGTWTLGNDQVSLSADFKLDGSGGRAWVLEKIIRVDCDRDWDMTLAHLMHEAIEYSAVVRGVRYAKCASWGGMNDFHFSFDHVQFTMIVLDAGEFLAKAVPALLKYWEKIK